MPFAAPNRVHTTPSLAAVQTPHAISSVEAVEDPTTQLW